jgi:hypothetical protein
MNKEIRFQFRLFGRKALIVLPMTQRLQPLACGFGGTHWDILITVDHETGPTKPLKSTAARDSICVRSGKRIKMGDTCYYVPGVGVVSAGSIWASN